MVGARVLLARYGVNCVFGWVCGVVVPTDGASGLGIVVCCWVAGGYRLGVAAMIAVLFVDSCITVWVVVVVFVGSGGLWVRAKRTSLHFRLRTPSRSLMTEPSYRASSSSRKSLTIWVGIAGLESTLTCSLLWLLDWPRVDAA